MSKPRIMAVLLSGPMHWYGVFCLEEFLYKEIEPERQSSFGGDRGFAQEIDQINRKPTLSQIKSLVARSFIKGEAR